MPFTFPDLMSFSEEKERDIEKLDSEKAPISSNVHTNGPVRTRPQPIEPREHGSDQVCRGVVFPEKGHPLFTMGSLDTAQQLRLI